MVTTIYTLCRLLKRVQVTPNNSVDKDDGILHRVPFRYIHDVALDYDGPTITVVVDACNRPVVTQAVFPADNFESDDVVFLIENLELLSAGESWHP